MNFIRQLISALAILLCITANATTYYIGNSGNNGGDGLSIPTAFTWSNFTGKTTFNNATFIVLNGFYETNIFNRVNGPQIESTNVTLQAQTRWGVTMADSAQYGFSVLAPFCTIDGFVISNTYSSGVQTAYTFIATNLHVQNCHILYCGNNPTSPIGSSGISSTPFDNLLSSNNLIEHIGNATSPTFDHGIYAAGNSNLIINTVIRYCTGAGIQCNDGQPTTTFGTSNMVVNNCLIYSNNWGLYLSSDNHHNVQISIIGNTLLGRFGIALETTTGGVTYCNASNNIIEGTTQTCKVGANLDPSSVTNFDYNLIGQVDNMGPGAHGIVTANPGFVNPYNGLYWLATGSPAIGAAAPGQCAPVNFFGAPQASVSDIGAFQYQFVLTVDGRNLDSNNNFPTSSGVYPSYWAPLQLATISW